MDTIRSSAVLVLAVALLVGCGSDEDPAAQDPTAEESVADPAEPNDPGEMTSEEMTSEEMTSEDMTSEDMTSEDEEAAESAVITISDFEYSISGTVSPGSEVSVRNEDGVGHTVTSDDGLFDVAVDPGGEATFTAPDEPGEFPYHCIPHPNMTSTLVVG
jgi:plastocyanin